MNQTAKFKKKRPKYCNNCNKNDHGYKECKEPITSYGIICYRKDNGIYKYLIIRRRNSFSYTDFIRALRPKQHVADVGYIALLLSRMSDTEQKMLQEHDFDYLWSDLWLENKQKHDKDYKKCKKIFNQIIGGELNNGKKIPMLKDLIIKHPAQFTEAEWGFPKGKRDTKESDLECAKREFTEETDLDCSLLNIHEEIPPMYEEYRSINEKNYRSIYYLAEYKGDSFELSINLENKEQYCEVDKIMWASLDECKKLFRNYYTSKIDLLTDIDKSLKIKDIDLN